jgi:hypothetical protein
LLGLGISGFIHSWYLVSTATTPPVPSPRSRTKAASKDRRLLRYEGSNRPGEWANRTSDTVPGVSGHQVCTARSARARSVARSPKRLKASVGDHSKSAHSL